MLNHEFVIKKKLVNTLVSLNSYDKCSFLGMIKFSSLGIVFQHL